MLLPGLLILATFLYGGLLYYFKWGWEAIPQDPDPSIQQTDWPLVAIIIPARNEEQNIGNLLQALATQSYPLNKMEVLVIDDHSTDRTAAIVSQFPFAKSILLEEEGIVAYKKKALEKGIANTKAAWILCTDADCIPTTDWVLIMMQALLSKQASFLAAPVYLKNNGSLLGRFQTLDFLVLQGITGAGLQLRFIYMANGANLGYPRTVFETVKGYEGNEKVASGDDFFLLHKIKEQPAAQIYFLKKQQAIMQTTAMPDWTSFIQQRIRWASKSPYYSDIPLKIVLASVWMYNTLLVVGALLTILNPTTGKLLLVVWLCKTIVEWPFVKSVAGYFNHHIRWLEFFLFQPLHVLYITGTGLLGLQGSYEWKGRQLR
ncbi:MAG: glycosyltransferase [Bacteroidetes bacterium]|nr:glycosyltransferase [Bacteroidota bacterium]